MIHLINQVSHVGGGQKSCQYLFKTLKKLHPIQLHTATIPWNLILSKKSIYIISLYYPTARYLLFSFLLRLRGHTVVLLNHNLWSAELANINNVSKITAFFLNIYLFLFIFISHKTLVFSRYHQRLLEKSTQIKNKYFLFPFKQEESIILDKKSLRKQLGISLGTQVLLFIGRLQQRKGLYTLIDALALLVKNNPKILLLIVYPKGIFSESDNLKKVIKRIKKYNLSQNVQFISNVQGNEVYTYYTVADIFVMSSLFLETFGWTFFEAIQTNTQVISFANGYPGMVCRHCLPDNLIEKTEAQSLAQTIKKVMKKENNSLSQKDKKAIYEYVSRDRGLFLDYLESIL